jgi:hypothetical protein
MNDLVQLPLTCISNALPKLNPKSILSYFHPLDTLPTTPCYYVLGDENATPICSHDESAHMKLMHHKSILQHQPTIDLFAQNLPCRASNALEHATKSNADATFQNSTPTHGTSIDITFQNPTQRTLGIPTSHNPLHKKLVDLVSHSPSPKAKGCTNDAYGINGDHVT